MFDRIKTLTVVVGVVLTFGTSQTLAANYETSGNVSASTVNTTIAGGGVLIFTDDHEITMDTNLTNLTGITVNAGKAGTINFNSTTYKVRFKDGNATISIPSDGSLTIGAGAAGSGIDFATNNTDAILTINRAITGDVTGNKIFMGNNTLKTTTAEGILKPKDGEAAPVGPP